MVECNMEGERKKVKCDSKKRNIALESFSVGVKGGMLYVQLQNIAHQMLPIYADLRALYWKIHKEYGDLKKTENTERSFEDHIIGSFHYDIGQVMKWLESIFTQISDTSANIEKRYYEEGYANISELLRFTDKNNSDDLIRNTIVNNIEQIIVTNPIEFTDDESEQLLYKLIKNS